MAGPPAGASRSGSGGARSGCPWAHRACSRCPGTSRPRRHRDPEVAIELRLGLGLDVFERQHRGPAPVLAKAPRSKGLFGPADLERGWRRRAPRWSVGPGWSSRRTLRAACRSDRSYRRRPAPSASDDHRPRPSADERRRRRRQRPYVGDELAQIAGDLGVARLIVLFGRPDGPHLAQPIDLDDIGRDLALQPCRTLPVARPQVRAKETEEGASPVVGLHRAEPIRSSQSWPAA